jgi:hypothetical protein
LSSRSSHGQAGKLSYAHVKVNRASRAAEGLLLPEGSPFFSRQKSEPPFVVINGLKYGSKIFVKIEAKALVHRALDV